MILKAVAVAVMLLPSFSSAVPAARSAHAWSHVWSITAQGTSGSSGLPDPATTTPSADTASTVDFGTTPSTTPEARKRPPMTARTAPQPRTLLWLGLALGLLPLGLRRRNKHRGAQPPDGDRLRHRSPR